ncbi:hypothetical protein ACFV6Z_18765 [Streptomyces sp. NPDC059818]|uniref:hypothetical protein n=1 Tax=Streptomyces sp. NPDC059818 TaxID=3346962 RepID=UPI003652F9AE
MERWKLTWTNRDAMLGEAPARPTTEELDAPTEGLSEDDILHTLHHTVEEYTDGAGVLTGAEKADA